MRLFCYGKADYCDKETCTGECEFHDGSGSEYRRIETNAERIRSMTDSELAEFLCSITDCYNDKCPAKELCHINHNGMMRYLKRKAEED